MAGLLRPEDLNQIASDAEMEKMDEERRLKEKKERQELELREAFMSREIHPEAIERINNAVRVAAKQGNHQLQVITFPCKFCTDGGRRINIGDPSGRARSRDSRRKPTSSTSRSFALLGTSFTLRSSAFPAACLETSGSF